MSTIPKVSEQDIRDLVDVGSFQRGQQYFRGGAIIHTRQEGMSLKAQCQGSRSQPYRVEVMFDEEGIADNDCSCPLGSHCKHVVALLLSWLAQPDTFVEQEDVNTLLEQCDKAELIGLIQRMLRKYPELDGMFSTLRTQRNPADVSVYRRQIQAAFKNGNYEWGIESEIADDLLTIKEDADTFKQQQQYSGAIDIYSMVIAGIFEHFYEYENENGDFHSVVDTCVYALNDCLTELPEGNELRAEIVRQLFDVYTFDINAGGIGIGDDVPGFLLENCTQEEKRRIVGWLHNAIAQAEKGKQQTTWPKFQTQYYGRFLLQLTEGSLDDELYLQLSREGKLTGKVVERLLELGRIDEALGEAQTVSDYDLLHIADIFVAHERGDSIEPVMIQRSKETTDRRVLEWLQHYYEKENNLAAALKLAINLFQDAPLRNHLDNYQEIRQLATRLNQWEEIRPQLIQTLRQADNTSLLVQIALEEGDIDRALALVKGAKQFVSNSWGYGYSFSPLIVEVARATEASRPDEAIAIYQRLSEQLIAQRGRGSYQAACQYLAKVKELYERMNKHEVWAIYIDDLRQKNKSLRALKEELQAAHL